jgi:SAM-dependent methyltransferase
MSRADQESARYERQDRGDRGAYDHYLRGMDASMRQKVALTAAHLLSEGDVADMGMGSGSGSFALAALYPDLSVVGVDVNPTMVALAAERHRLPNLRFVEGDVAAPCFERGTMEAIVDSSVLHHVTSFNGYDREAAARALVVQAEQLAPGGVIILRDFLDPGPAMVWLDLPADDGRDDARDPMRASTAALFERFAREFRVLLPEAERGFGYERLAGDEARPIPAGWRRYRLRHTHAAEFVLRKDYRESWDLEVQEEYTYGTQAELEATFARIGLRVLASVPIYNPWIVQHRFRGKLRLWTEDGRQLDYPATNYVIVGQKVRAGEGVSIVPAVAVPPLGFLELGAWRRDDGRLYDLARRPGMVIDAVPWFEREGAIFVVARRSYPRPVLGVDDGWRPVGGATAPTYVTEPLSVPLGDKPFGQTVEEVLARMGNLAGALRGFDPGARYFPSPGGIQEEVRSMLVEIAPLNVEERLPGVSGFSTSGLLASIEARQLLRAAQVGGLPDARLELNTYELLLRQQRDVGDWIGESVVLEEGPQPAVEVTMAGLAARGHRRRFRRAPGERADFLELRAMEFSELDAAGNELAHQVRELVIPRPLSRGTVAVAVLRRHGGTFYLGLDDDDLPAAQCFDGNSEILVAPAWRIPREIEGIAATRDFVVDRLGAEYGLTVEAIHELGGRYHPSPGLTPEVVYPFAVQVQEDGPGLRPLLWARLDDVVRHRHLLVDGHLRVVALRAAHALGALR